MLRSASGQPGRGARAGSSLATRAQPETSHHQLALYHRRCSNKAEAPLSNCQMSCVRPLLLCPSSFDGKMRERCSRIFSSNELGQSNTPHIPGEGMQSVVLALAEV